MVLATGPRVGGQSILFLAIQTHPSGRFLLAVDSVGLRGRGLRRNSSIRCGIFRIGFRGTATSAIWNVT
jgi:hypothetical protein